MIFIELHLYETDPAKRNSRPILLNVDHITAVSRDHDGLACVRLAGGDFSNVAETYKDVTEMIRKAVEQ